MKICVTSAGADLNSEVDPRFGRCQCFIVVDPETMKYEAIQNPNIGSMGGAGIQSAQLIASKGVEAVLTGNVGPNAYQTLQAAGVKIIVGIAGIVKDVAQAYKRGEIHAPVEEPSVPGHFGQQTGANGAMPGMGMGSGMAGQPPVAQPSSLSKEQELQMLKQQMDQIKQRIKELDKKSPKKKE